MNLASESTGMSVLRPIANSQLLITKNKDRVWSDHYFAWGFFCNEISMSEEFLIWCSIDLGDRILLNHQGLDEIFTVVNIKRDEEVREAPLWIYQLLGTNLKTFDVKVKEKELFIEASKLI